MTDPRDDFAAIPILMELVREPQDVVRPVATEALPPGAQPGREAQQSLFDDLPVVPPRTATKRARLPPTLRRLAEDLLRAKAPAIINELADEHARRLSTELRERLRRELSRLLEELAGQDSPDTAAGDAGEPGQAAAGTAPENGSLPG